MNFKMKRAASARIGRKVAGITTSILLATSSVPALPQMLNSLAPQTALAESVDLPNPFVNTIAAETGVALRFIDNHVDQVILRFAQEVTPGSVYNIAKVIVTAEHDGTGSLKLETKYADGVTATSVTDAVSKTADKDEGTCKIKPENLITFSVKPSVVGKVTGIEADAEVTGTGEFTAANLIAAFNVTKPEDIADELTLVTADTDAALLSLFKGATIDDGDGTAEYYTEEELGKENPAKVADADVATLKFSEFGAMALKAPAGKHFTNWTVTSDAGKQAAFTKHFNLTSPGFARNELLSALAGATAGDIGLKANYAANAYTVTFNPGTANYTGPATLDLTAGDTSKRGVPAPTPQGEGITFAGWQYSVDGATYLFTDLSANAAESTVKKDGAALTGSTKAWDVLDSLSEDGETIALKAVFTQKADKQVKVATVGGKTNDGAYLNDGTALSNSPTSPTDQVQGAYAVAKTNSFRGWYAIDASKTPDKAEAEGTLVTTNEELTADDMIKNLVITTGGVKADTLYVAVFGEPITDAITLSFDVNGGKAKEGAIELTNKTVSKLSEWKASAWTKEAVNTNYEFEGRTCIGWSLDPNADPEYASNLITTDDQIQDILNAGENVTLYAVWRADASHYVLEASAKPNAGGTVANDGVVSTTSPFASYKNTATPAKGYRFAGWYLVTTSTDPETKGELGFDLISENAELKGTDVETTITKVIGAPAKEKTYRIQAEFAGFKYNVIFGAGSTPEEFTVGEDKMLPVGASYYYTNADGTKTQIETKEQLDALVTKNNDIIQLTAEPIVAPEKTYDEKVADFLEAKCAEHASDTTGTEYWYDVYAEINPEASTADKLANAEWYVIRDGKVKKNDWADYKGQGNWYYCGADGKMLSGVNELTFLGKTGLYYFNELHDGTFGAMKSGWFTDPAGTWYYGNIKHDGEFGKLYANGTFSIDGKDYTFDAQGKWIA